MKNQFNVGDWCYYDFDLKQVVRIEDGRVYEVTDGYFNHGGDINDHCFPIDLQVKVISNDVEYWYKEFHKINNNGLNIHGLIDRLTEIWVEMCENKDNKQKLSELYDKLNNFGDQVVRKVRDISFENVDDVKLYK